MHPTFRTGLGLLAVLSTACGTAEDVVTLDVERHPFSSDQATLLSFEFDGEMETTSSWNYTRQIEDQMLYTVGQLNGDNSVGRLDKLEISNVQSTATTDGRRRVTYRAKLPVGWGDKDNLPTEYTFKLPKRIDHAGQVAFTDAYKDECVDWSAHDVDVGSMWYYYRPARCTLDPEDIVTFTASVTVSNENTTGKYPEYHMVWDDDRLDVVAIFGKYEDGATSSSDAGISAYNRFVRTIKSHLGSDAVTVPENVPSSPGVEMDDIEITKDLGDGQSIRVNILLVDNVRTAGRTFNLRYEDLSTEADLIIYGGHAGLGANIRALARKGEFRQGKYKIFFMNGCDTFAYVDSALNDAHAEVNPDDPNGTKYLDIMTNIMPSYFHSLSAAAMALIRGLQSTDEPQTFEQMMTRIDHAEVVAVTGEEDNVYYPGYDPTGGWEGLDASGKLDRGEQERFTTPALKAGTYSFILSHDPDSPSGDVDLYVKVNNAPTTSSYDCRPYLDGSDEECSVRVSEGEVVHVLLRGYSAGSAYILAGRFDGPAGGDEWEGLEETGFVGRNESVAYETPLLQPGSYSMQLRHDPQNPGGDADLYVRVGSRPTTSSYDCRPYVDGSDEDCTIRIDAPAQIHIMVRGYQSGQNHFVLRAN